MINDLYETAKLVIEDIINNKSLTIKGDNTELHRVNGSHAIKQLCTEILKQLAQREQND